VELCPRNTSVDTRIVAANLSYTLNVRVSILLCDCAHISGFKLVHAGQGSLQHVVFPLC